MRRTMIGLATAAGALAIAPGVIARPAVGVIGTGTTDALVTFDTDTPGTFLGSETVTGLLAGERLVGVDYRWVPAAASAAGPGLYGLGRDSATGNTHAYRIDIDPERTRSG